MTIPTKTDIAPNERAIDDRIMRLREWGTDTIHLLPVPPLGSGELSIGSAEVCSLALHDPTGRVSRLHARLVQVNATKWVIHDLGSKNGMRINGARSSGIALEPGDEIGIGGDGDVVPIARAIHRRAFGAERPFIVCDPRRRQTKETVRSPENYETGMPAFAAATGGSLCMRSLRLPKDFRTVITALRDQSAQVRLVMCAQAAEECDEYLAVPIAIPTLTTRPDELDRIITEYADDAITELGTLRTGFLSADRAWVRTHSVTSLPDIERPPSGSSRSASRATSAPQPRGSGWRRSRCLAGSVGANCRCTSSRDAGAPAPSNSRPGRPGWRSCSLRCLVRAQPLGAASAPLMRHRQCAAAQPSRAISDSRDVNAAGSAWRRRLHREI